jgi:hypothetical protein
MDKSYLENITRSYVQSLRPNAKLVQENNNELLWHQIAWESNSGPKQQDSTLAWLHAAQKIIDNEIAKLLY